MFCPEPGWRERLFTGVRCSCAFRNQTVATCAHVWASPTPSESWPVFSWLLQVFWGNPWSQTTLRYSIAVRNPTLFRGVIPIGGGYVPAIDAPPPASTESPPKFYFMVGQHDSSVRANKRAAKDFAAAGYDAEVVVYPDVGHAFPQDALGELRQALDFVWKN